ncbi:7-cyano-7-deazaguanine synthase [Paraburkholderia domus]|uniref:7-cyano-7-deazaguanine synthase n=1 Tax=Paraburkholderia domus TaxID=2793075 RepID=UPI0019123F10|nr:7-cyano-7-deazaguanine synthase [Paraburkholderia domus]MBK5091607.1 7-cyano-7-deazaguanine synthase [Burkholderia sp. R-69927]CAE6938620.1 7-cyano-7-deazaguanine synthase [Paraburkholderia domus]
MSTSQKKPARADKRLFVVEKGQKRGRTVPKNAVTVEVGKHIHFDASALDSFDVEGCTPMHYDMLVLCAAVEFADRRWKRPLGWRRILHVTLPVADPKRWQKSVVLKSLHDVLNHLTGDTWQFSFVQAKDISPISSRQMPLDFAKTKTFAVAYSNGLDSRAVSALSGDKDEALCIRVAGNHQRRKDGDSYFTQIPFEIREYRSNESSFRSRGFQFAAVTAIAAQLSNVTRIVVPESGQGALGPVLLPLYNIYVDYRNYPTFFRKMEQFIEALQHYQVRFEQPRLWSTKGQTLSAFLRIPGKSKEHLTNTRSCWQTRRVVNVGSKKQCGLCAACLLRRLSLHAAGVNEAPDTYVVFDLAVSNVDDALSVIPQKADRDIMAEYGSVGVRHLQHLADMAGVPDDVLRAYASQIAAATGDTYEETLKKLKMMLVSHAEEWRAFLSTQGQQSFLKNWMDGGRYG